MTGANRHILAEGEAFPLDTRETQLNNNVLVVGPSGSGKTRHYVKPNLLQMAESFIVTDTKGLLHREVGPVLAAHGYDVSHVDLADPAASPCGYDPLDSVCLGAGGAPSERDVMRVAAAICPVETRHDPYWELNARSVIAALVAYVMAELPPEERTFSSVTRLASEIPGGAADELMESLSSRAPRSLAARKWKAFKALEDSEKTYACVASFVSEKLDPLSWDGADALFSKPDRVDFASLGERKSAVFLTVSDTDRSLDRLVTLLYAQALQALCDHADRDCGGALPVPVRLYLDDFATNCRIDGFDGIVSVIRSRNVAVSVVLQSITQFDALYGHAAATTIVNGCDRLLYLGGQDVETARFVGQRAGKTLDTILGQPAGAAWLVERGSKARAASRYELAGHPLYGELPEARPGVPPRIAPPPWRPPSGRGVTP